MEAYMAQSLHAFKQDVHLTMGQFRANGLVDREAKRLTCQIFAISVSELNSILESHQEWTNKSNHSKKYNEVSKTLFNI